MAHITTCNLPQVASMRGGLNGDAEVSKLNPIGQL